MQKKKVVVVCYIIECIYISGREQLSLLQPLSWSTLWPVYRKAVVSAAQ